MEVFSKATLFNLLAIALAVGLLIAVFVDLMRPQLSRPEAVSGNSPVLDGNFFSKVTLDSLIGEPELLQGIDVNKIAEQNPFRRQAAATGLVEPEDLPKEPEPREPLPATRKLSLVYRGLYRSSSGEPFAYVQVGKETKVYAIGETVVPDWKIVEANVNEIVLKQKGEVRVPFPFNQKKSLEVPME